MHTVALAWRRVAPIAALSALAACSSDSSPAAPHMAVATSPPLSAPAVDSAIVLGELSLGALQADAVFSLMLAPNHLSIVMDPTLAFAAACDSTSATAQSVTLEQNSSITVVRTAIYPPGDMLCASAPEAIAVIGYPAAATFPRIGYGYLIDYALSPLTSIAVFNSLAPTQTAIYVAQQDAQTVDFVTDLDVTLPTFGSQPLGGSFPGTFPRAFADGSTSIGSQVSARGILALATSRQYYAAVTGTNATTAGWVPFMPVPASGTVTGISNSYAFSDAGTLQFATQYPSSSLKIANDAPSFAISRSSQDSATILSTFPLAAGQTHFNVGTSTSVGQTSTAANFPQAPANAATFASDGTIVASHQHYVDAISRVGVDLNSPDGVSFTMTTTDLIANASLTTPANLTLTPAQIGPYCTFGYTPFAFASGPQFTGEFVNYSCPTQ